MEATVSSEHGSEDEAIRYGFDYGYYMVECPHCQQTNDVELDFIGIITCVTCEKQFKVNALV